MLLTYHILTKLQTVDAIFSKTLNIVIHIFIYIYVYGISLILRLTAKKSISTLSAFTTVAFFLLRTTKNRGSIHRFYHPA